MAIGQEPSDDKKENGKFDGQDSRLFGACTVTYRDGRVVGRKGGTKFIKYEYGPSGERRVLYFRDENDRNAERYYYYLENGERRALDSQEKEVNSNLSQFELDALAEEDGATAPKPAEPQKPVTDFLTQEEIDALMAQHFPPATPAETPEKVREQLPPEVQAMIDADLGERRGMLKYAQDHEKELIIPIYTRHIKLLESDPIKYWEGEMAEKRKTLVRLSNPETKFTSEEERQKQIAIWTEVVAEWQRKIDALTEARTGKGSQTKTQIEPAASPVKESIPVREESIEIGSNFDAKEDKEAVEAARGTSERAKDNKPIQITVSMGGRQYRLEFLYGVCVKKELVPKTPEIKTGWHTTSNGDRERFDDQGRLVEREYKNGESVAYDNDGEIKLVRYPQKKGENFPRIVWYKKGHMTHQQLPDGSIEDYDENGKIVELRNAEGKKMPIPKNQDLKSTLIPPAFPSAEADSETMPPEDSLPFSAAEIAIIENSGEKADLVRRLKDKIAKNEQRITEMRARSKSKAERQEMRNLEAVTARDKIVLSQLGADPNAILETTAPDGRVQRHKNGRLISEDLTDGTHIKYWETGKLGVMYYRKFPDGTREWYRTDGTRERQEPVRNGYVLIY